MDKFEWLAMICAIIFMFLLLCVVPSSCTFSGQPNQYTVTCYSGGEITYNNYISHYAWPVSDVYKVTTAETDQKVLLPMT